MHHKTFMILVPTIVAAYNLTMNGVDRVDQLRSTNPTRRKEQRLPVSFVHLGVRAINAYSHNEDIERWLH